MIARQSKKSPLGNLVQATLASVRLSELSDGELLTRFVAFRDEAAFAELVRRLGPTVFGVCRRILQSASDAEDAFQVTFLVLARKAGRIRPPGRVAAWLYGVAVLAAKKARVGRTRRLARESTLDVADEPSAEQTGPEFDLASVLDEEIQRLPDRYREALVLCEVREQTIAQAAAGLGLPVGTVASRLSRGRALLADRLKHRGITGAAVLVAGTVGNATAATVPQQVLRSTITAVAGGGSAPGVPQLLRKVLWTMSMNKVLGACAALIAATAVAGVVGGAVRAAPAPAPAATAAAPVPAQKPAAPPAVDHLARIKPEELSRLVRVEAVQKDLGLTKDQKKKLSELRAARDANALNGAQEVAMILDAWLDADEAFNRGVAEVVTAEQLKRLKQLSLQTKGPACLFDRRVMRAIELTIEQEDRIESVLSRALSGAIGQARAKGEDLALPAQTVEAAWEAALKVLTAEQRTRWDTLIGKRMPAIELLKVNEPDEDN